jgi:hypothetical protein
VADAYPLTWPEGWPRTADHRRETRSRFNTTFDRARMELMNELRLLGAAGVVISSWLPLRRDGMPYADQARRRLTDPGVAVYFMLRKRQMVMARDAFTSVHDNMRSIGLGIAHLRGLERHGGGTMMERAFEGFAALPAPDAFDSWSILGLGPDATADDVTARFRTLSRIHHPDAGGTTDAFQRIERARREAINAISNR